jgi:hypothetical protein
MAEIEIPHAESTFVETDPPRKILHVVTRLIEHPGTDGFDAEAKHALMQALGRLTGGRGGFDAHTVHWATTSAPRAANRRPADVVGNAVHIMKVLTGETDDEAPVDDGKDPSAKALGAKGGAARAANMTAERRSEIARVAASKRWGK